MDSSIGLFAILSAISVITGIGVIASRDAVRSALSLVVNLFVISFIYFSLRAELLGITQIMVYVGAIMVLFLFVVMLLNLSAPETYKRSRDLKTYIAIGGGVVIFYSIYKYVIAPMKIFKLPRAPQGYGSPEAIGKTLFSQYVWPFEIISILLLVGVVGSILLAKRRF